MGKNHPYARSGVYNSCGQPIRNPAAYAAAGGRTFSRSGGYVANPVAYSSAIEVHPRSGRVGRLAHHTHGKLAHHTHALPQASVRQNTDSPKYLYHYTDSSSASKIQDSGTIRSSTHSSDCALGRGVYLTAKPPRTSTNNLLDNNYAGAAGTRGADKVQSYVRVDADRVAGAVDNGRGSLGRDVFVHRGDLNLSAAGAKVRAPRQPSARAQCRFVSAKRTRRFGVVIRCPRLGR